MNLCAVGGTLNQRTDTDSVNVLVQIYSINRTACVRKADRQIDRDRHMTDRQTENTILLHKDKDLSTSRQERERLISICKISWRQ